MHLLLLFCAISFYSMISNFNTYFCQLSHCLYMVEYFIITITIMLQYQEKF